MSRRRFAAWLGLLSCTAFVLITPLSGSETGRTEPRRSPAARSIVVTNVPELDAALAAGTDLTIFMQSGTYQLNHAIRVPANTALIGQGTMTYDSVGLPAGFAPEGRTVLVATASVMGDFVTLADGASVQGLVIQDAIRPALPSGGSVVMVRSGGPAVSVSAQILECEIINPNLTGSTNSGATGRGLSALTQNSIASGGVSHDQSVVSVALTHSIIRSVAATTNGTDSIFAINNASGSHIELHLRENVLGRLTANGGVSRPESTVGATVLIQSHRNLYRADTTPAPSGWVFNGGADAPMIPLVEETLNNTLTMHSVDDRIEGFGRAITATAALRMSAQSGAISSNKIELILQGTRLASLTSDFQLFAARSIPVGMAAGDGNELRVTMRNVTGSGPRTNTYGDFTQSPGIGNRFLITGNPNAFSRTNQDISPMPGDEFFTGNGGGQLKRPAPLRFRD
jgi:hypothetical protein